MARAAESVDLSGVDTQRAAQLDAAIYAGNIDALRGVNPELAALIESTELPTEWHAVHGLDGALTYRLEAPGEPPEWLAATAAPRVRAEALAATYELGTMNATLPALGNGAELLLLLERLPRHVAVFVFEPNVCVLAAVLRCHDLSAALRQSRCVLVPPDSEQEYVLDLLEHTPGLLPPGNIARLHDLPPERVLHVRDLCQSLVAANNQSRMTRQVEVERRLVSGIAACGTPVRLALMALASDARGHRLAASLCRAAESIGWPAMVTVTSTPRDANTLAHNERLADFGPSALICVGASVRRMPEALRQRTWELYSRAAEVPSAPDGDVAGHLAATPAVTDALHRCGVAGELVHRFHCACDEDARTAELPEAFADQVVLVGDLPNDDPEVWGVVQPTHKLLWQALRRLARESWERDVSLRPGTLLDRAGRIANMPVSEASVRDQFVRLIER
ncbi:MAG: hypothetical protein JXO22_02295, partial [Phycisphaerae bacterium]|nr:hypothetical protein [Phycisphaerae bacterium]